MTPREKELTEQLAAARQEIRWLRQKIDLLVRRVFGASSERLDVAQLELLLPRPKSSAPEASNRAPEKLPLPVFRSRRDRTPRLPENLPIVEEIIDPAPVKAAPEQWHCIGQEVSEQLDYEPARFLRRRTIRKKYVHRVKLDESLVIAPLPARLQDRSLPAPGLLAHILVAKYCDHLPLYRQEQIFARRHQVQLPRQTLARWVELAAGWLQPIYEAIRTGVMAGGYVQVDETPIKYLEPGHGRTKQGYFWTASRPQGDVFFRWETSRVTACLDQVVPLTFTGTLQSDGYSAYRAFVNGRSEVITLAGCWAHVRRKFYEASETAPQMSGWLLRQIQHRYRGEAHLSEHRAGPLLRQALRASQSRPIIERLEKFYSASRRVAATCRRAVWVRPLIRRSASGARWQFICRMAGSRLIIIWSKTPFAPRPSARKTGCSSATPKPANAAPSSRPSSKAAGGAALIPTLTSATSSPASRE
jgi:transposase